MLNDNCPFSLWTVIVAAATISVHGGQLSLMDSYRCYNAINIHNLFQNNDNFFKSWKIVKRVHFKKIKSMLSTAKLPLIYQTK